MVKHAAWMWFLLVPLAWVGMGCHEPLAEPVATEPEQERDLGVLEEMAAADPAEEPDAPDERPSPEEPAPPVDTGVRDARTTPSHAPQPSEHYAEGQPSRTDRIHVVRPGDTLYKLSREYYGTHRNWRRIYEANRTTLTEGPDKLEVGMRLVIP